MPQFHRVPQRGGAHMASLPGSTIIGGLSYSGFGRPGSSVPVTVGAGTSAGKGLHTGVAPSFMAELRAVCSRRRKGPFWAGFSGACSGSVWATVSWPGEIVRPLAHSSTAEHFAAIEPGHTMALGAFASSQRCHRIQHKTFLRNPPGTPSACSLPDALVFSHISQAL